MNAGAPYEPTANARAGAKGLRDMFLALVAEGFTERQALEIIGQILAANGQGA